MDGGWFGSEGKKRFETKIHYYLSVHIMYSSYTEAQIVILFRRSRRCVVEVQFCGSYKGVKSLEECVCVVCLSRGVQVFSSDDAQRVYQSQSGARDVKGKCLVVVVTNELNVCLVRCRLSVKQLHEG